MKRYMICPVIGAGTHENPYRAAVADIATARSRAVIRSNPQGGPPLYAFAFCRVAAHDFAAVFQVTNSYVFPDFPLDSQMSSMESGVRTGLVQSVQAFDLDGIGAHFDASHADADSFRQLIQQIATLMEPAFNANFFDVEEPDE